MNELVIRYSGASARGAANEKQLRKSLKKLKKVLDKRFEM